MNKKKTIGGFFEPSIEQLFQVVHLARRPVWLWVIGLPILLMACGNDPAIINEPTSVATSIETSAIEKTVSAKSIQGFIADKSSISSFRTLMSDIHSLETLSQINSKRLILFIPEDAAFEKLGKVEKEKLLDKAALAQRHQLFKNSLIIQDKKEGNWNGQGETYGGASINVNFQTGLVSFKNSQARILRQIQLKDGHLLYIVDNIFV